MSTDEAFPPAVDFTVLEQRLTPNGIQTIGVMDGGVVEIPPIGAKALVEITRLLLSAKTGETNE